MKKYSIYIISVLLVISLASNLALFFWGKYWKDALVGQFITTYEIEHIFRKSGADISFDHVHEVLLNNGVIVSELNAREAEKLDLSLDDTMRALRLENTVLLFKDDAFIGSKSIHPNH
ncbi:hypothetical protein [Zooshikella ganghwensis]|uniref:hypothetical protein n=1 Tax=Zooshikella ganghwensis TaxID=202772 RepID=UPI0012F98F8D|nr:hypothetical protein [Zooshikella ganghwensis]